MNITMISATFIRRAVRIILFFSWIYKKSVMSVFNNQKRSLAFFICGYAVELYFLYRNKRVGKRFYRQVYTPIIPLHVDNLRSCETASGAKNQEACFGRSY